MRDPRLRLGVGIVAVVLFVLALVALNDGDNPQRVVASDAPGTTASSIETTTTSSTSVEPATTSSSSVTLPASPTTRVTSGTKGTAATATTAPPRPLVLSRIDPSIAAPCHNPSTTTTAGNGGTGINEIDGCHYFAFYPLDEKNVPVTLRSDRGVNVVLPSPCQENGGQCHAYISLSGDRAVGDRECFFLTSTAPGWATRSNDVCITWPRRGQ